MIFRNWVLQNFPFLEDEFDALTDYELFCKMVEYMKKSLKKVEDFQGTINEFTIKLDEFQHWFDNLDVTEEVNAKLDEMVEDGTMEELIAEYLQLQTTYTYNSVSELKLADNLQNGMFVRTSGYNSYDDGGGAFYKIRNVTVDDVIDEMFIIELADNTIIAEYIVENNSINIKQFGCVGNHTFDNTAKLQAIINKAEAKGYKILIPNGEFLITDTLYINDKISIEGLGDNRLWKGTSYHPMICGYITDKPFIFISDQTTLYNWDTAKNNLVESVHIKNLRLVGSTPDGFSMTGIFASCYLSTFDNLTISGFYNDITFAGCYETLVNDCRFTQSYQNIVLFNNNRTTIFTNVYCNGGYHTSGSVIDNATYITNYPKNHMLNYACIYSNLSYHNFYNLAVEDSCYGIISRDSELTSNITNFESLSDYCVHCSLNLKSDVYTNIDNAHFFNPDNAAYTGCKMFYTSYHSYLNLKTVDALPVDRVADGDITNNSVARIYSYVTGEKIIPLTLSANVEGATLINRSHYTRRGFKVDFEFGGQTVWSSSTVTSITGLPASTSSGQYTYRYFTVPTNSDTGIRNIRFSGTGLMVNGSGSWIGGNSGDLLLKVKVAYEYDIT